MGEIQGRVNHSGFSHYMYLRVASAPFTHAVSWEAVIQPKKLATAWSWTCKFTGQELII